jgi:peptide deformylase
MNIVKYPSKWLTTCVDPYDFEKDGDPQELVKEMILTMEAHNGIGLSAPQVEVNKAVFVFKPHNIKDHTAPIAVINPTILTISDRIIEEPEGCLSHPGLYLMVKRPEALSTEYLDIHGQRRVLYLHGIDARCFLHEFDHLTGTDFTKRVSKIKVDRARKKLKKEKING